MIKDFSIKKIKVHNNLTPPINYISTHDTNMSIQLGTVVVQITLSCEFKQVAILIIWPWFDNSCKLGITVTSWFVLALKMLILHETVLPDLLAIINSVSLAYGVSGETSYTVVAPLTNSIDPTLFNCANS